MKEIVTLQVGNFSNYVGAHWVNIQEAGLSYNPKFIPDIDSRRTFREGLNQLSGEFTYTPRLLLMDLDDSLGYLPQTGGVYDQIPKELPSYEGTSTTVIHKDPPYEKNQFILDMEKIIEARKEGNASRAFLKSSYNLTGYINSWTDFLVQRLHPRTINLVPNQYKLLDEVPFSSFDRGLEVWKDTSFNQKYTDKLQDYMEECDSLQGFQTIVDVTDGFAGLAVEIHEYLNDEYSKKALFSCLPTNSTNNIYSNNDKSLAFRNINIIYALSHFSDSVDLILPISTSTDLAYNSPQRKIKDIALLECDKYQHSAVLAAALEAISLPYRIRTNDITMKDYISQMCVHGRRLCSASICFPFPLRKMEYLLPLLERWEGPLLSSLTPCIDYENLSRNTLQYINSKGIMNDALVPEMCNMNTSNPAYNCQTVGQMMSLFCQFQSPFTKTHSVSTQDTFRAPVTYPDILNEEYNLVPAGSSTIGRLSEFKILAGLHNSIEIKSYIDNALRACAPNKIKSVLPWMDGQELSCVLERLTCFGELYSDNWHL